MNNMQNRGNAATLGNVVENTARDALQGGMTLMEIIRSLAEYPFTYSFT